MSAVEKYILGGDDGHTPIRCDDVLEWGRWYEDHDELRTVGHECIGPFRISTRFFGLDTDVRRSIRVFMGEDPATLPPPRLFETMIFADALETAEQMRASFGGMMAGFRGGGGDGVGAFVDDNQFGGYRERCATWDQAVAQHATAVACVRRSMSG